MSVCVFLYVCVCVSRYFAAQSALGRRREPNDVDSDADEVSDDEFDAFLGKRTSQPCTYVNVVAYSGSV